MNELISIIVPVYKVEKYIDRCINSLVCQSYTDIEIILVDDGSPDRCPEICDAWSKKDNRVLVIHKTNGGLSDARNAGISVAKGKYICFVDSDDYVANNFIEVLYKLIKHSGSQISAVDAKWVYEEDSNIQSEVSLSDKIEIFDSKEAINNLLLNAKYKDYAWNKMYTADLFENIRYPVGKNMEDLATTYKLFYLCNKIIYNPSKLYFYFQRKDSILHTLNNDFYITKLQISRERYESIKNKYPDLISNDIYMFSEMFGEYPYVNSNVQMRLKKEMALLWPKVRKKVNAKTKIKYFIFLFFRRLYIKRFKNDNYMD